MSDPLMHNAQSMDPSPSIEKAEHDAQGFAWYVMFALGCALFVRFFIAAPYLVSGASMEPTFDNFDYLITDRLSYDFSEPARGDVIVFCLPHSGECSLLKRLSEGTLQAPRTLIKRVIGLPGETVSVSGGEVRIINAENPEGFVLEEPYLDPENIGGPSGTNTTLGEGEYFVMGDNRRVSSDSRVWGILPKENIVGHVVLRLFPFSSLDILPGDANPTQ